MRRSDEILAPDTPFHTHCELKAEFFYTVAEWQLRSPLGFRLGGLLHGSKGGILQEDAGSLASPSNRKLDLRGRRLLRLSKCEVKG
jgi:hypothetical protein